MTKRWFVVQTKVSREVTAAVSIAQKGFVVFSPIHVVTVMHAKQRKKVERPLFPRYLFVTGALNIKGELINAGNINYCRGVISKGLLCDSEGHPQPVSDAIIEGIRKRETAMKARAGKFVTGYRPGDEFRIATGPFAEIIASYLGEERGRVSAIIHLFGRPSVVKLSIDALPPSNRVDNLAA